MSTAATREQMILDAERIRKKLEEIRAKAQSANNHAIDHVASVAIDLGAVQRKHGVRTLELIDEVNNTAVTAMESVATLNTQGLEHDIEIAKIKEENEQVKEELAKGGQECAKAVKTANLAKSVSSSALNVAQQAQLEASMKWVVIKNIPLPDNGQKESYRDRFNGVMRVLVELNVDNVQVHACHRLPVRPGSGAIPNMRVQLGGDIQRQLVFEGVDKIIKSKANDPQDSTPFEYIISADVPTYAKRRFKDLNQLAQLHRDTAPRGTRTRVAMKGAWPALFIRPVGKNKYEQVTKEFEDQLRSKSRGLKETQKRKQGPEPMELSQPSTSKPKEAKTMNSAPRTSARLKSKDL